MCAIALSRVATVRPIGAGYVIKRGETTWPDLVEQGQASEAVFRGAVPSHKGPEQCELALLDRGNQ